MRIGRIDSPDVATDVAPGAAISVSLENCPMGPVSTDLNAIAGAKLDVQAMATCTASGSPVPSNPTWGQSFKFCQLDPESAGGGCRPGRTCVARSTAKAGTWRAYLCVEAVFSVIDPGHPGVPRGRLPYVRHVRRQHPAGELCGSVRRLRHAHTDGSTHVLLRALTSPAQP
jgi:hypothetical protein